MGKLKALPAVDCGSFFGFDSKDQPCSVLGKVLAKRAKFKYIDLID
jgi:hypothetical protein